MPSKQYGQITGYMVAGRFAPDSDTAVKYAKEVFKEIRPDKIEIAKVKIIFKRLPITVWEHQIGSLKGSLKKMESNKKLKEVV